MPRRRCSRPASGPRSTSTWNAPATRRKPLQLVVETQDADDADHRGVGRDRRDGRRATGSTATSWAGIAVPEAGAACYAVGRPSASRASKTGRTYGESGERTFVGRRGAGLRRLSASATNLSGFQLRPQGDRGGRQTAWRRGDCAAAGCETAQITRRRRCCPTSGSATAPSTSVIGTGADRAFWETLAAPQHEKRRKALVEWVRRGGRVVISVGTNPDVLEALKEIQEMLPATVPPGGKRTVHEPGVQLDRDGHQSTSTTGSTFRDGQSEFAVATLAAAGRTGRPTHRSSEDTATEASRWPSRGRTAWAGSPSSASTSTGRRSATGASAAGSGRTWSTQAGYQLPGGRTRSSTSYGTPVRRVHRSPCKAASTSSRACRSSRSAGWPCSS